jgi:hypothetical protein
LVERHGWDREIGHLRNVRRTFRFSWPSGRQLFCSRSSATRRDVKRIIPSLAYSLSRCLPDYRSALINVLEDLPDVSYYGLHDQFSQLIVKPLELGSVNLASHPIKVVVIDALDECDIDEAIGDFLDAVLQFAHLIPIKIFLSSRPEYMIRGTLEDALSHSILRLHDVKKDIVEADIYLFLKNQYLI